MTQFAWALAFTALGAVKAYRILVDALDDRLSNLEGLS